MLPYTLNIKGSLRRFDKPTVMGIINATPDSFYEGSRIDSASAAIARAAAMVAAGAAFIDVGACSTRPGSQAPTPDEELARLEAVVPAIKAAVGDRALVSVDTYRADVARHAVEDLGADIINDVSGGLLDDKMFETVAELKVPYILSHMRGTPADMHEYATYTDVTADVLAELGERLSQLALLGVNDVIVDPGFGFAKTFDQNYELLARLSLLRLMHRPVLVGMSRKSMATRLPGITVDQSLPATTALNTIAIERGAAIVRVHDVEAAATAVAVCEALAPYADTTKI